jgi:hypothetical protein
MGGLSSLPQAKQWAARIKGMGRDGDSDVVHVNEREKRMLKAAGGRGSVNPKTGLREYATADNFDAALYLQMNHDVAADPFFGANPLAHYQQHGQNEARVGNQAEVTARQEGYGGNFGGGGYVDWKNQQDQTQSMGQNAGLNANLSSKFGYGGDFGLGGFNAYTSVQSPERQQEIANYIAMWNASHAPQDDQMTFRPGEPTYRAWNATPASKAAYYGSQGIELLGGTQPYGARSERNFFPGMGYYLGSQPASGFNEAAYLAANPDVQQSIQSGQVSSGWEHYIQSGRYEGRPLS